MNILMIGNGFDLAHKLPTKYTHFLRFLNIVNTDTISYSFGNVTNINDGFYDLIKNLIDLQDEYKDIITKLLELTRINPWYLYFDHIVKERQKEFGDGWIDFENEIENVINSFTSENLNNIHYDNKNYLYWLLYVKYINYCPEKIRGCIIDNRYEQKFFVPNFNISENIPNCIKDKNYIDLSYDYLSDFIKAFEIYLFYFIETMNDRIYLKQVNDLAPNIDNIISFNYTHTFARLYKNINKNCKFHYIHGQTNDEDIKNFKDNIVIGIRSNKDDYLCDGAKNKYIKFKKYYQRECKNVDKNWRDILKKISYSFKFYDTIDNLSKRFNIDDDNHKLIIYKNYDIDYRNPYLSHLYIFGHSLDSTDSNILIEFINNIRIKTTIFYTDDADKDAKIANLISYLGPDVFSAKTNGKFSSLEFVQINND